MNRLLKLIFVSTLFVSIAANDRRSATQHSNSGSKSDTSLTNRTKAGQLLTSDQNFNYDYVKQNDNTFANTFGNNGKSYLKEVHYFHDKQVEYENKHDWDSDLDRELIARKAKKDLHNKRKYGKNYGLKEDIIEVQKWDDHESNGHFEPHSAYNHNHNDYNRFDDKNQIRLYTEINPNNDNDYNFKIDVNRDEKKSYNRREGVPQRGPQSYVGQRQQKWFTNWDDDKDQSSSIDIEVKDEDNYNNYVSPKFNVNFQTFRPWNAIMRNRRHEDNYDNDIRMHNNDNDLDIYVDDKPDYSEQDIPDDRHNYKPKLLTNLYPKERQTQRHDKTSNYANYDNQNNKEVKYKTPVLKETVGRGKARPKKTRDHYEKRRVVPQTYANSAPKADRYSNGRYSPRDQMNRKFIERPYDVLNTGWSSDQKPTRHRSDRTPVATVRQYRYGF